MVKYLYTVTIDDYECDCNSVKAVVKQINTHSGCNVVTVDMVNTLLTRPEKANKRLFCKIKDDPYNKISVERRRLPTKGELAQAQMNKINAMVEQMTGPA